MLDTLIAGFKGFFSRAFWFGSFLPVAIFGAVHLLLAAAQFPQAVPLVDWLSADKGSPVKIAPIAIAAVVVLAYTLAPLVPMLRGLLDGTLLPLRLHEALRRERLAEAHRGREAMLDAGDLAGNWEVQAQALRQRLVQARQQGATQPAAPDAQSIEAVSKTVRNLRAQLARGKLPTLASAETATRSIETMLKAANATLPADDKAVLMTQQMGRFIGVLRDIMRETQYRSDNLYERFSDTALDHYRATEVGDVRERTEDYSQRVYAVNHRFLWPRLQALLSKDDPLGERLSDAQAQVDFAVLSLALSVTVPLVWLPLLAATAVTPWLFLAVGTAAPLMIALFDQLLLQSQIALGTLIETAVDKYRLDVLTRLLRQPLPLTRDAERQLWTAIRVAGDTNGSLSYRHPA